MLTIVFFFFFPVFVAIVYFSNLPFNIFGPRLTVGNKPQIEGELLCKAGRGEASACPYAVLLRLVSTEHKNRVTNNIK